MNHKGLQSRLRAVFLGDYVSTKVVVDGAFEPYLLEMLERQVFPLVPREALCLDIGANIGNRACFFAEHFQRVVCFEPNPLTYRLLDVNAFGLPIDTVPMGLSDAPGKLWFRQNTRNRGASMIVEEPGEGDFRVEVTTLDQFARESGLSGIGFVKMDVEEHELQVLKGARETLHAQLPVLAMEGFFGDNPIFGGQIEDELRALGYTAFYRAAPRSGLARWLKDRGHVLNRGLLAVVLPERIKRDVELESVAQIRDENHELFIAMAEPREIPPI